MLSTRPKIAELVFQLYGRAIHPELFQTCRTHTIKRGEYEATLQITNEGHAICWRFGGLTLTEVAASAQNPLPQKRRLMSHSLQGEQADRVECRGGVVYESEFSLESVDSNAFYTFQDQLRLASAKEGLLHQFESSGRFGIGAMSYLNVQSRDRMLKVRALHTFPDNYAIVKSQSVFRLP
ncbi:MAG: DUF2617 family protein [Planctomycetales bacterium]|nr:DUF2617 family protein [Planctomycetales bacterium]